MATTENEIPLIPEPTDFGDRQFQNALVIVTNACNLTCQHCFVFRDDTPNNPRDKMSDRKMLRQLEVLRDKHGIKAMLFMGGEPMIKKELVLEGMKLFEKSSIVTNGTYGIPSVPGHLVTVSLDGPEKHNDEIRGEGVFQKVKKAVFERDPTDGTIVMLQMVVARSNADYTEEFLQEVQDWPLSGVAFTFYVPTRNDQSELVWHDLKERDEAIRKVMELKSKYPILKVNIGTLELMMSAVSLETTGENGDICPLKKTLPLYVGEGGEFERTFCCYGNDVDCSKCGAYGVFNSAYHSSLGRNHSIPDFLD